MKKLFIALTVCFFSAVALADVFADVTVQKYPDADAVLVDSLEETRYKPDGAYTSYETTKIKVLTEKGRREESVINLSYNARYGMARIVDVTVTGVDGVERKIDFAKTTKESTDNSSVSANIYDPMDRQVTCSVPGLKIGEVLSYSVCREMTKSRVKDQYANVSIFEWTCPILKQEVRIIAPKERPLKKMAVRNPLGNVTYETKLLDDGSTMHIWKSKDSKQAFAEPEMPPMYTQVQGLYVSTAENWEQISKWYWDLCQPHLAKATPAITNRVNEIVASVGAGADDLAKIGAIYKWVAQEIRYMGLTMEETSPGYAPHDVDLTFNNRYGVCRDKAALLSAMLRIAGFEAYPVLIHAGAKMDAEVPLPYFNHAITAVRAPGNKAANKAGYILMDPTDESSRDIMPAYLGDRSYLVATPFGETLHVSDVPPALANSLYINSQGTVEKDGSMLVKSTILFNGLNDNAYRQALLRMKSDDRRRLFERVVLNTVAGAELLSFELLPVDLRQTEAELKVNLLFRINEAVMKRKTTEELQVPHLSRALGVVNWVLDGSTSLAKRRFPLVVSSTAMAHETIRINLPESLGKSVFIPPAENIDGAYSYKRVYNVNGSVFEAQRTIALNNVEFSPAEYESLLKDLKRVEAAERSRPVFAKSALANADVRYREMANYINVTSPTTWVVTNSCEKEILTYEGKKKSAELKFSYNPSWKTVKVISAQVISPNGAVSEATEREMSELDCGWAASAPRYPASKELVVNLPSVEIGSVIKYVTVTTVTNAPAPFYAVWNFDSTEPIDKMVVDYRDWKGGAFKRVETDVKRIASEPMQAPSFYKRDCKTISLGSFDCARQKLCKAVDVKPHKFGKELASSAKTPSEKAIAVRNWVTRNIRIAGPHLYETPLEAQMASIDAVISERYASRLDYMRTMCALLKGAGLNADIVFIANDGYSLEATQTRDIYQYPCVGKYSIPLCRVKVCQGGLCGFGATEKVWWIGTENEYTPLGTVASNGSTYLDLSDNKTPSLEKLITVDASSKEVLSDAQESHYTVYVNDDGSVNIDFDQKTYGAASGAFRKIYSEMLPEDRSRHFQEIIGSFAQAATATSELVTDVKSYPSKLSFSLKIPDYVVKSGDALSISVPEIGARLFSLTGSTRVNPLYIGGKKSSTSITAKIIFPKGYTKVEHLPAEFNFECSAASRTQNLRKLVVKTSADCEGRIVVELVEFTPPYPANVYAPEEFARFKDFSRIASSRANRTIVVRKGDK